jgi:hydrogenase small subunit
MVLPNPHPWAEGEDLGTYLSKRGISRRDFLGFCARVGVILGLGELAAPEIARALSQVRRPSVVWLQLQECTGCFESTLRTTEPTIGDLILDVVSLDYQHTVMAAAGHSAEAALQRTMEENQGSYVLLVTGSIPLNEGGAYTLIGGRTARAVLEEAAAGAAAVIAVGACAHWGGVQGSRPNPTGAVGVNQIVTDQPVVNVAGCPPIGDVVTATITHFLTFGRLPELDYQGRPLFAYGARVHDQCPRRSHFDAGQFVEAFDDESARDGWCLYRVGCKGTAAYAACPIFSWNAQRWAVGAGHPCIGCTEPRFWDTMTPLYDRLPGVAGFGVERTADQWGAALAIGATAGVAAHAIATGVHRMRRRRLEEPLPVVSAPGEGPPPPAEDWTAERESKEGDNG